VYSHISVLVPEVIELLSPGPGKRYLDGTLGGGGHSERILINSSPDGQVLGLDRDDEALGAARERLRRFDKRLIARQASFAEAFDILGEIGWQHVDGAILDLGISSHQIDSLERGFSFRSDAALDMRMDRRQSIDAREIVNSYAAEDLARIFREYGEEPAARRIASQIVKLRKETPFRETIALAKAIEKIVGRHGRRHPATQIFQALRMEVNDELGALQEGLVGLTNRLEPGARIAVIAFHSLEDRIVKNFFRDRSREFLDRPEWPEPRPNPDFSLRLVTPKAIEPDAVEQRSNPRSRSARLRVAERIG